MNTEITNEKAENQAAVNCCFLIWNKKKERPATPSEINELVNGEDRQLFMSWTDILPSDKEKGVVNLHIDSGKEDFFELRFVK